MDDKLLLVAIGCLVMFGIGFVTKSPWAILFPAGVGLILLGLGVISDANCDADECIGTGVGALIFAYAGLPGIAAAALGVGARHIFAVGRRGRK